MKEIVVQIFSYYNQWVLNPSTSSAQFVKNYHAAQYTQKYPSAVEAIWTQKYVDDYMNNHDDVNTAVTIDTEIFKDVGFQFK